MLRRMEATWSQPWAGVVGLATAVGIACFLAARFSLALVPEPNLASELLAILVGTLVLAVLFCTRRSYEVALKERNDQLQLALDAAELGVWSVDLKTGRFESDARDRQINGHDPAAPPKTLAEVRTLIRPDDLANLDNLFKASARTGRSYKAEYRLAEVVGQQERWVEVEGSAMRGADGRPARLLGITRDITDRKRAEADLAERQAQLALFVEHAPAAIAMFDQDMRYLAVSRRYILDFRLSPNAQLIGRSHYEVFPEIPQRWRDIHARVLAGDALANEEDQFTRQDGYTEWTGWAMAPWRKGDGRIGGAVLFAEVKTEQIEAQRALADSEARFRATFENAAVGVALVSTEGSILRANNSFARMLGYSVEELTMRTFQDLTHPDDLASNLSVLNKTLAGETESYCIEKRYVRKDGGIVWASLTVGCVRKPDGRVDYFVSVVQDITARKRVEEQQRTLLAELDHRVKNALATVSAVVSHTQQESRSIADFVTALDGRIRSMATTHELLSSHRWQGVSLSELVRRELEPYAGGNTDIDGPFVGMLPEAAQAVAMVLHELATNAAKHGAFSKRGGRVFLRWWWQRNGAHDRLAIEWKEAGGPSVLAPSRPSYGTAIIHELIPFELGGAANLTFAPEGIQCRLEIPDKWVSRASQFSDDTRNLLSA